MKKYKLTNQQHQTYGGCQWGEGVTHTASGTGELCSRGWLHYYHSLELAVLLSLIHVNIVAPLLWECEAEGKHLDDHGLKGGCTKLTTLRIIPLPVITTEMRVRFGVLCSLEVYNGTNWTYWANDWLSGKDRSKKSASAALAAARDAAETASWAAFWAASAASAASARPADQAAAAFWAALAAEDAANAAADTGKHLDLQAIAKRAIA